MRYHYIPYSKPSVAESILEENPVVRTWWGQPILTKRVYAMDGDARYNMSEEENEIADMTPAQYKKWAMEIGEKPRKGFHSELIYHKAEGQTQPQIKNQTKMNIDKNLFWQIVGVGGASAGIAYMLKSKNPILWGFAGALATGAYSILTKGSAKTLTVSPPASEAPNEEKENAVGSYPTRKNVAERTIRTTNIHSNAKVGDKAVNVMNDQFSLLGAGLFSLKPSSAKKGGGTGDCCAGYWNGDICVGTLQPCGSKPVATRV